MKTQSLDTHLEAEEVLVSLLRKLNASEKFARIASLSQTAIQLSKRAIARAHPELDERQVGVLFVEYQYGKALADRLRQYLEAGRHE